VATGARTPALLPEQRGFCYYLDISGRR